MPAIRADLFAFLDSLGIATETVDHAPVFTVEESRKERGELPGGHTKNLFLKDKKGQLFLVTARENAKIDLKKLHEALGASGRLSFGNSDLLMETLGVTPGSVTAFAVLNDRAGRVKMALDAGLMMEETIHCHPLTNDATTALSRDDLLRFLRATGHEPMIVALPEPALSSPAGAPILTADQGGPDGP